MVTISYIRITHRVYVLYHDKFDDMFSSAAKYTKVTQALIIAPMITIISIKHRVYVMCHSKVNEGL